MEVTEEVIHLNGDLLITNLSGDTIHIGEYGTDQDNWFPLEVGSGVSIEGAGEGIGVVSDGVSEVGILPGGTGIFPPAVTSESLDLSAYLLKVDTFEQQQAINPQTGTSYTLDSTDLGKLVTLSNAAAITLTFPQDSDETIPIGSYGDLMQLGAGQVTAVAGTGATLRVSGLTAKARAQYSRLGWQKIAANTFVLFGDLAAS